MPIHALRSTCRLWRATAAIGFALLVLPGCTRAMSPSSAIPNDGQDDAAAIQADIDTLAEQGGGIVQLEAGQYDLARPLFLRDNVTLSGRGPDTHLTGELLNQRGNWGGVAVFAGSIGPVNYSANGGLGYPEHLALRTDGRTLTLTDCPQSAPPPVGTVVWLSTTPAARGLRNAPLSEFGELNRVASQDGCSVELESAISAPVSAPVALHWADGSAIGAGGIDQLAISNAGLENLRLSSASSQALIVSGCFQCRFSGLTIGHSRRLISIQGTRGSVYEDIAGTFSERGIEFAMFATENTIRRVRATYSPEDGIVPKPAIRFGEFARDNLLEDVTLELGAAYMRRGMVRFDESTGNRLHNITLLASQADEPSMSVVYRGPGESQGSYELRPPGTMLEDVQLCAKQAEQQHCETLR